MKFLCFFQRQYAVVGQGSYLQCRVLGHHTGQTVADHTFVIGNQHFIHLGSLLILTAGRGSRR